MLFDTHCHLYMDPVREGLEGVLERAVSAGVRLMLVPGIDRETSLDALSLAHTHSSIVAAVGNHPCYLPPHGESAVGDLADLALDPRAVALGETGLDLHHSGRESLDAQREWLASHCRVSSALGKTLIAHSRDAEEEVCGEIVSLDAPVVLHCYTGDYGTVRRTLEQQTQERPRFAGFTGCLTYPSREGLREMVRTMPADSLLIETDTPFMAPRGHRGKPSEPSHLPLVLEEVARCWGCDIEAAASRVLDNSQRAFQLGPYRRTDLVYRLGNAVYVNVTGRCNNDCLFCVRKLQDGIGGYLLAHRGGDPGPERLAAAMSCLSADRYDELVFCGYGEPTLRHEAVTELASGARSAGWKTRLNTNGLMLSFCEESGAVRMLKELDCVSISLNAHDAASYESVCRPGVPDAWDRLLAFVSLARRVPSCSVRATAVRWPGLDADAVAATAERLGLPLRIRG
ncbi:TatD family hydrolase [Candidatus Fermentibacterales bacterium]|nr:TatD family hydrolase [Candidatus Fermentibacterales bacterium]